MKPGTKEWAKRINTLFFVSRGFAALTIILLLLQQLTGIYLFANSFVVIRYAFIGIYFYLPDLAPVHEMPRWEIVFPELRKRKP